MTVNKHDAIIVTTDECPTWSSRTRYVAVVGRGELLCDGSIDVVGESFVRGTRQHSRRDSAMKDGLKIARIMLDSMTCGTYDEHVDNNVD
jgi:hypothetical protein